MAKKKDRVWVILTAMGNGAVWRVRFKVPHSTFYMDSSAYWITKEDAEAAAVKWRDQLNRAIAKNEGEL